MADDRKIADQLTAQFRRAIDTLFLANPVGTSLGVLLGIFLNDVFAAFALAYKGWALAARSAVHWWAWVAFGAFAFNLRPYLRRHKLDPSLIEALEYIRQQEHDASIPQWQIRATYQNLFTKVLERLVLEPEIEKRLVQQINARNPSPPPA